MMSLANLYIDKFETELSAKGARVDYVTIAPSALERNGCATKIRVAELDPANLDHSKVPQDSEKAIICNARWEKIGPAYEAWKTGNEIPEHGTPLAAWAGLTNDQANALRVAGVRTIEEVVGMNDSDMAKIRLPNVRALRDSAKTFMDNKDSGAVAAELASTREAMAEMQSMIDELKAAQKPKRGRPPKDEAA